jgi:hypothetical protein
MCTLPNIHTHIRLLTEVAEIFQEHIVNCTSVIFVTSIQRKELTSKSFISATYSVKILTSCIIIKVTLYVAV